MMTNKPVAARALAAALVAMALSPARPAVADEFPTIEAADLNGRRVTLPRDLPGARTLVLVVFERAQQPVANAWIEALDLRRRSDISWIELPVLRAILRPGSAIIDAGMRSGLKEREARARIVTTYGQQRFARAAGIASFSQPYAMVVERSGAILVAVPGVPTASALASVTRALGRR